MVCVHRNLNNPDSNPEGAKGHPTKKYPKARVCHLVRRVFVLSVADMFLVKPEWFGMSSSHFLWSSNARTPRSPQYKIYPSNSGPFFFLSKEKQMLCAPIKEHLLETAFVHAML
eukprot:4913941-Amphidinium_carterae.1